MARTYLKKAPKTSKTDSASVHDTVRGILNDIEEGGEAAASVADDHIAGHVSPHCRVEHCRRRSRVVLAHENIKHFAEAQKASMHDFQVEVRPGLIEGQKTIPVRAAGCYVPGGRYSHIASAMMTVTTAKVAGVSHITACSPPQGENGVHPAIIYAANLCGADKIMALGGVQGVAAMTFGLFDLPAADIIVGPGNQFVAEAKRILFGRVGIDMIAGPTDSLVLADADADAEIVSVDLVSQAEHGYNSPVWLVTDQPHWPRRLWRVCQS